MSGICRALPETLADRPAKNSARWMISAPWICNVVRTFHDKNLDFLLKCYLARGGTLLAKNASLAEKMTHWRTTLPKQRKTEMIRTMNGFGAVVGLAVAVWLAQATSTHANVIDDPLAFGTSDQARAHRACPATASRLKTRLLPLMARPRTSPAPAATASERAHPVAAFSYRASVPVSHPLIVGIAY
jgi:hypothetical protein